MVDTVSSGASKASITLAKSTADHPSDRAAPTKGKTGAATPALAERVAPTTSEQLVLRPTRLDTLKDGPTKADLLAQVKTSTTDARATALNAAESSTQRGVDLDNDEAVVEAVVYDRQIPADQRLQTLVEAMERRSPQEAQDLFAKVLDRGGHDVFSVVQLQRLKDQGQLTDAQARVFADSVAGLYNDGRIDTGHIPGLLHPTPNGQTGLGPAYTDPKRALEGAKLFFGASNSSEFNAFAKSVGHEAIRDLSAGRADWADSVIAGLDASGRSSAFLEPYARLDADQRMNVLSSLGEGGLAHAQGLRDGEVPVDGLNVFLRALGAKPGEGEDYYIGKSVHTKWDDLAVEAARFSAENPDQFRSSSFFGSSSIIDSRAEALGALFAGHDRALLDAYTDAYRTGAGTQEPLTDKYVLANLLDLTANNAKNSYSGQLQRNLDTYTQAQAQTLDGGGEAGAAALGRLQMIFPARLLAVGMQGLHTLEGKKAFADLVGDIVNIGLTVGTAYVAVPASLAKAIPALVGAFDQAKSTGAGLSGAAVGELVYDALVAGEAIDLEELLKGTADLLIAELEGISRDPVIDAAIGNPVRSELAQVIDAIRDRDFSRFRDALSHD